MMLPNWFEKKYEAKLQSATPQQALELVAKDDRVQKAVADALKSHDEHAKKPGWAGPSRAQSIRQAITECLAAQD